MSYVISLSSGKEIEAFLCGDTWMTSEVLTAESFRGGLGTVKITGPEPAEGCEDPRGEFRNMMLDGVFRAGERTGFALSARSMAESDRLVLRADIDYIAMMLEVEL